MILTKGERVKAIRIKLGTDGKKMTLEDFGNRLGVSKNTISNIENGNRNLTDQMCKSISREFGVSEEWLRYGTGGEDVVFEHTANDAASTFAKENGLDSTEEILLREYLKLKDDERSVFKKYLRSVLADMNADSDSDQEENEDEGMALLPFA